MHKLQKICRKIQEKQNTQGFTLVELIVVLTILTILAVMLIPTLQGYLEKLWRPPTSSRCAKPTWTC